MFALLVLFLFHKNLKNYSASSVGDTDYGYCCVLLIFLIKYEKDVMSCLPKPVLRGYSKRKGFQIITVGCTASSIIAATLYFGVKRPRRLAYENFLKTYDGEAHFKDLKKWGYFRCFQNAAK